MSQLRVIPMQNGLHPQVKSLAILASLAVFLTLPLACAPIPEPRPVESTALTDETQFSFCTWNVENLFDDKVDRDRPPVDRPYDTGFAENDALRKLKYQNISSALLRLNHQKGPDIIACVEVESVRAAEILVGVLNSKIRDSQQKYRDFAMKDLDAGRHIAPCVISRLPLARTATKLHGKRLRILETKIVANGHALHILSSHWTSKRTQPRGGDGESGRENYARTIRGVYTNLLRDNPSADVIVCGDFNDVPTAEEIEKDLGAIEDIAKVRSSRASRQPLLLNLMANKSGERFGTLWYDGKPLIYDHICVSPGMLDSTGWGCDVESVRTETSGLIREGSTRRQPWRFGDPDWKVRDRERGYADHFPVTVTLSLQASSQPGSKPNSNPRIPSEPEN